MKWARNYLFLLMSCWLLFVMNGCYGLANSLADTTGAPQTTLVVLTKKMPLSVSQDERGENIGLEYDRLLSFARHLNANLTFKFFDTDQEVFEAIRRGEGDLAAARLRNRAGFLTGPVFEESDYSCVCKRVSQQNESLEDVLSKNKKIVAMSGDSKLSGNSISPIADLSKSIEFVDHDSPYELLKSVANKEVDCAILESGLAQYYVRLFSSLAVKFKIQREYPVVWFFRDENLKAASLNWFSSAARQGVLAEALSDYLGHLHQVDILETRLFFKALESDFPKYEDIFKRAGVETSLPWKLLAAVSFQESHWQADARSFTGVRGLMMLTEATAATLMVNDRNDPEQSVFGGAKLLRRLIDQQPPELGFRNRLQLALAAYNIGSGHLKDAMTLASSSGQNPKAWHVLKAVLPMLSDEQVHVRTEFGFARGSETVKFVDRVMGFYEILVERIRDAG